MKGFENSILFVCVSPDCDLFPQIGDLSQKKTLVQDLRRAGKLFILYWFHMEFFNWGVSQLLFHSTSPKHTKMTLHVLKRAHNFDCQR